MTQYGEWQALAEVVATDAVVFSGAWKKSTAIRGILEHVSLPLGAQFLARIAEEYPDVMPIVADVCGVNDSVGDTHRFDFGVGRPVGPTSIRYVFHACEVLSRASRTVKIVEVGCGYGGLALIMSLLAPHFGITIENYCLYDLPQPQLLQKKFISVTAPQLPIQFGDGDFGAKLEGAGWVLVSAYGIGEFPPEIADRYLANIVPKTSGGFLVWNTPRNSAELPPHTSEVEAPQTGVCNRVLKW
jgi:hypothetical protein